MIINRYPCFTGLLRRLLMLTVLLTLSACGGSNNGSRPQPGTTSPPVMGNLENEGTVVGVDGVAVHAMTSTLNEPVNISIGPTNAPKELMDPGIAQLGGYYKISTERDVFVENTHPFVLSFPVPSGVDTTHLALAILISAEMVMDVDLSGNYWSYLPGKYDPATNAFVTTIPSMISSGLIFSLVQNQGYNSNPSTISSTNSLKSKGSNTISANVVGGPNPDYEILCDVFLVSACEASPQYFIDIVDILRNVHNELISMQFPEPWLNIVPNSINISSNQLLGYAYLITIVSSHYNPVCLTGVDGYYQPLNNQYSICVKPDNNQQLVVPDGDEGERFKELLRHEYFHAIQNAYTETRKHALHLRLDCGTKVTCIEKWFIEGTAAAAERSYIDGAAPGQDLMQRNPTYAWYNVEESLISNSNIFAIDLNSYRSQDFWVYAGNYNHQDMSYLQSVLENGSTIGAIRDHLADTFSTSSGDVYWRWVKNQAYELSDDYHDSIFSVLRKCYPNPFTLTDHSANSSTKYGIPLMPYYAYTNQSDVIPRSVDYVLPPLTSLLINLKFIDGLPSIYVNGAFVTDQGVTISGFGSDPEIRYKVYDVNDLNTCADRSDGDSSLVYSFPYNSDTFGYILVSNTSFTDQKTFRFTGYRMLSVQ